MHLTNYQRVAKLFGNLMTNPRLIAPYIKHNLLSGNKFPMDLGLPWWSYTAIDYVDTLVEGKRIFEYGTGGSTIRYAKKARSIVAVEDDKVWADLVAGKMKEMAIDNVSINYCQYDFHNTADFDQSDYIKSANAGTFDIFIIDGQDHTFQERIKCFHQVEPLTREGSVIIVDDYWRYEVLRKQSKAKEVKVFESVGPCRYGVTSTAVFLY